MQFEDPRDADDAIYGRDGYDFDGYRLRVSCYCIFFFYWYIFFCASITWYCFQLFPHMFRVHSSL